MLSSKIGLILVIKLELFVFQILCLIFSTLFYKFQVYILNS